MKVIVVDIDSKLRTLSKSQPAMILEVSLQAISPAAHRHSCHEPALGIVSPFEGRPSSRGKMHHAAIPGYISECAEALFPNPKWRKHKRTSHPQWLWQELRKAVQSQLPQSCPPEHPGGGPGLLSFQCTTKEHRQGSWSAFNSSPSPPHCPECSATGDAEFHLYGPKLDSVSFMVLIK